jgi:hypothetical protein
VTDGAAAEQFARRLADLVEAADGVRPLRETHAPPRALMPRSIPRSIKKVPTNLPD